MPLHDAPTQPYEGDAGSAGGPPVGARIGRFAVVKMLGTGGMGVVIAAHDPELDRAVAIKLLKPDLTGDDPDGAGQLQREAQAMARLSHPNVVAVYEIGRFDDRTFIAMELVEGETLRGWLATPRPWRDVVAMFVAAGRGLAAAHAAGLVHRDFKPDNVLVGGDGRPRVTDFGLVVGQRLDIDGLAGAAPPVRGSPAGTPAYMSPEHWRGDVIDPRSDQFSFCVALWEALDGRRPYRGSDARTVRAAVSAGELEPVRDEARIPRAIAAALRRGLALEPGDRWPDLPALLAELERATPRPRRWWIAGAIAAGAVAAATAVVVAMRATRAPSGPPPFAIDPDTIQRLTVTDVGEEYPTIASDGTIYFDAPVGQDTHLFALDPTTRATRELTHNTGWALAPAPSPDGKHLAYLIKSDAPMAAYVADDIAKPEAVRQLGPGGMRPVWSPDGRAVWTGNRKGIVRRDLVTAAATRTLMPPDGAFPLMALELADHRVVILTRTGDATADGIALYPADSDTPRVLVDARTDPGMTEVLVLAPDGAAVLVGKLTSTNTVELWRVPLDGAPPTQVPGSGISARQRLALHGRTVVWSDNTERTGLATVEGTGPGAKLIDLTRNAWDDYEPSGVPGTGELYFVSYRSGDTAIWCDRRDGSAPRQIPFGGLEPSQMAISPDRRWIAVAVANHGVLVGPIDGSAPPHVAIDGDDGGEMVTAWSHDGTQLYVERVDGDNRRIAVVPAAGGAAPAWLLPTPSTSPATSPVANQVAYLGGPAGATVPMILDVATGKSREVAPGITPYPWRHVEWSPDGTHLLATRNDGTSSEIDVATGAVTRTFDIGADQLMGATYVGTDIVIGRSTWIGDVWMAQLK